MNKTARLPHHSFGALNRLLDQLARDAAHDNLPKNLTRSYWSLVFGDAGESLGYQVIGTCRFLGLIEGPDNSITPTMLRLIEPTQREQTLKDLLEVHYADAIKMVQRFGTTRRDLERAFQNIYGVRGQTSIKGVAFFLSAAQYVKLPISASLIPSQTRTVPVTAALSLESRALADGRRTRQTQFSEVAELLASTDEVHVRMAFRRTATGTWYAQITLVDIAPAPAHISMQPSSNSIQLPIFFYNYGNVAFFAGKMPSEVVGRWFLNQPDHFLSIPSSTPGYATRGLSFTLPKWNDTLLATRFGSYVDDGFGHMVWPHTLYNLSLQMTETMSHEFEFLIADGCPFFPDYQTAVFVLLYGETQLDRARSRSLQDVVALRVAHADGWLERVHLSPTSVSIDVIGSHLQECRLLVSNDTETLLDTRVQEQGQTHLPLPHGLPRQLWIMLARGQIWLDHVSFNATWPQSPFSPPRANIIVSGDEHREPGILELIFRGEGPTTEFKEAIPQHHDQMLKTVAAFANGEGGVILLGVRDGSGEIIGITDDTNREMDRLSDMIRKTVVPDPKVRIESIVVEHRSIVAIVVDQGEAPPYGLHADKPQYYVRRGATTFVARQEEIRSLVLASDKNNQINQSRPFNPYERYQRLLRSPS